jgi:hypothetical protein
MNNVTFLEIENPSRLIVEHAIINHGNEEYTSMLKSTYDAMLEAQNANKL